MPVTYFGQNDNGTSYVNFTPNYTFAARFLCGTTGTLTEIGINIEAVITSDENIRIGIYADSSGNPGALLLDAGELVITVGESGWKSKTGLSLAVTNGVYYWLAFNDLHATAQIYYNNTADAVYVAQTYGALEDPYGTPTAFPNYRMSLRAGVTTGGAAWHTFYTPYTYPHPLLTDPVVGGT